MFSEPAPSVPDVVRAFEERRTLTGSLSHREHVMIAWHYARTRPAPQALVELVRGIQELAVALGKTGLYHETLTWAWFSVIRERLERIGVDASWEEFAAASQDILSGRALEVRTTTAPSSTPISLDTSSSCPTGMSDGNGYGVLSHSQLQLPLLTELPGVEHRLRLFPDQAIPLGLVEPACTEEHAARPQRDGAISRGPRERGALGD